MADNYPEKDFIIAAYKFDGKGGGDEIPVNSISKQNKSKILTWVHLDANYQESKEWVNTEFDYLDDIVKDALFADETRPRVVEIGDGILVILRGVNLNENADPEDMVSIRIWVEKDRIISFRKRRLKAVADMQDKISKGKGPKDSGDFLCMIISNLLNRMEPVLLDLDQYADDIEEKVTDGKYINRNLRKEIVDVRIKAITLKRYMAPQRDAVSKLKILDSKIINQHHKMKIHEGHDRVTRYIESLDEIRERSQIVTDEIYNKLSDKLNKNTYVLSVIAAVFLPLGFLTGLLGINVGGIPGAENPDAFKIFSMMLGGLVALQVMLFKIFKWF